MTEFMLAHPWMSFWLLVLAILVFGEAFGEFAKALGKRFRKDE